jgi:hypothetical protein
MEAANICPPTPYISMLLVDRRGCKIERGRETPYGVPQIFISMARKVFEVAIRKFECICEDSI